MCIFHVMSDRRTIKRSQSKTFRQCTSGAGPARRAAGDGRLYKLSRRLPRGHQGIGPWRKELLFLIGFSILRCFMGYSVTESRERAVINTSSSHQADHFYHLQHAGHAVLHTNLRKNQKHENAVEGLVANINAQDAELNEMSRQVTKNANHFVVDGFNDRPVPGYPQKPQDVPRRSLHWRTAEGASYHYKRRHRRYLR